MGDSKSLYQQYSDSLKKVSDVRYASAVLQWDQETYLPAKGAEARARQLATLNELAHQLFIDPALGKILNELASRSDLSLKERKNVSLTLEDYNKQQKFSSQFIREMSEAVSAAFHSWIQARKNNDFSVYAPALSQLVELKRKEADILGFTTHPYNALLDQFEKGSTVEMVDAAFDKVMQPLKDLMAQVMQSPQHDRSFFHQNFPRQKQWDWGMFLIKQLGFDFEAGRQDISEHPFTTNFSARDVRITTRIDENDFQNMTWSCIHETGHALYEQGLPNEEYGLPSGEYASLSIHESQSRLWENCVGRGRPFWSFYLPVLKNYFPTQLADIDLDRFTGAINRVEPSLIRTEADELTYHFHVYIRYLLEKDLIHGNLPVKDIPSYWNDLYMKYLGIQVPDDKNGCLQDVHWSHGSFGYFPTYSLGSFYAAQFWLKAIEEMPALEKEIAEGDTSNLLRWLRNNIHVHGKSYTSEELCEKVTGKKLDSNFFIEYLRNKLIK